MERNFYNDEFEDLIRQKAGQYKMYPSDKVWNNIHSSLHTRKRWFIAGMFTLITGILFFAGKELLAPSVHKNIAIKTIDVKDKNAGNDITSSPKSAAGVSITPAFTEFRASEPSSSSNNELSVAPNDDSLTTLVVADPVAAQNAITADFSQNPSEDVEIKHYQLGLQNTSFASRTGNTITPNDVAPDKIGPSSQDVEPNSSISNPDDIRQTDLLQNIAPYQLVSPKKLNRKYWQVYLSPTASYRTLSGGDIYTNMKSNLNGPIAATNLNANLNQYINNKPAVGFEVGGSFLYRFTRNLSLKAGLQFNYSSYNINAYASNTQPATIALNSYGYASNTITSYSNIGTIGGKAAVNIQNQYYQLSAPLGFELRIMGNEKLQLHIGATVQPTYLLNRNAYLLTADYTNYTQEPSLFRRWNINGAVEAFVSYKTGSIRWQLGPQFRYQLLSTYTSQYPISENLKEFGVKLGISKTIW